MVRRYQCPECGEAFTLKGLNGHLRFMHGYDAESARKVLEDPVQVATKEEKDEKYGRVLVLMKRMADVKELIDLVEDRMWREDRIVNEKTLDDFREWLIEEHNDIMDELRDLTGLDEMGFSLDQEGKKKKERHISQLRKRVPKKKRSK